MIQLDVYGILPRCAGGTPRGGVVDFDFESSYLEALDGNGNLTIVVPDDSSALAFLTHRAVVRVIDAPIGGTATCKGEWRIRRITKSVTEPMVVIEAGPILHDLADVLVSTVTGIVPTYALSYADLTDEEVFTQFIQPSLVAAGYTWINAGSFIDTVRKSQSFERWTCLQLAQALITKSDRSVRLRMNGDVDYKFDVTEIGAGAAMPVILLGRNVKTLRWTSEGPLHATVVVPSGITPATELQARGPEEFAAKVTATGTTDITLGDFDGQAKAIYYNDQEKDAYAELLVPFIRLRDESGSVNAILPAGTVATTYACLRSTGSTRQLWVSTGLNGNHYLLCYDAKTRAFVSVLDLGVAAGGNRGVYYHAGTDRIYVANETSNWVKVVNPSTNAVVATITVTGAKFMAHASSVDRIYVTRAGNTVDVINPNTQTNIATITVQAGPIGLCYDSLNDRIVVCNNTAGSLSFINPNTGTVANTLSLSPAAPADIVFATGSGYLYVACPTELRVVDGSGTPAGVTTLTDVDGAACVVDNEHDEVWVFGASTAMVVDVLTDTVVASGIPISASTPGPIGQGCDLIAEQNLFWVPGAVRSTIAVLRAFCPTTRSPRLTRLVTGSTEATQKLALGAIAPIAVNDPISFRRTADGELRSALEHATKIASYGRTTRQLVSDLWRGERNYVLNAYGDVAGIADQTFVPGWDAVALGVVQPGMRVYGLDAGTWTSFNAQADGAQSAGNTIALKGMTAGHVLQVGTYIATLARFVARRVVVDGAGKATVSVYPSAWSGSVTDGQTITLERPPLLASHFASGGAGLVMVEKGNQPNLHADFLVPGGSGRDLAWFGCRVHIWRHTDFVPNTAFRFAVSTNFGATYTETQPSDTGNYSDKALVQYELWIGPVSIDQVREVTMRIRGGGTVTSVITTYVSHFMAVLGAEGNLDPFRCNASQGELYHSGHRALRDLADPPINFEGEVLEDDPAVPFVLGGRVLLEAPTRGIVAATPRIEAIRYRLSRHPGIGVLEPVITLDNRSPSLARTLAQAGIR